ncbi:MULTISPECIES: type VI secretion system tip protein TssI/VgrG [unclassified Mesorhizobium]|uniref:type VI secretion system tip protein TssI/VgrG n=1 Tax=unclassified Mesorhizobium TaxID=325217 RepID=UPI000BB0C56C|nr:MULTISPECIES: type VI secretion system tip protein TssI/VgrG [unclassified Mesorhizobium]TGT54434.1 type VI secretion system tip protein VgrG [Mesorhizobium sp. M00.F.Ca.ET.170.01.1.1]AZO09376.1 type VI secretion system tip protein VgrG [Mesorhizobium sp. M3A.F.Ca.ET.080.04.2.1]PBB84973.1 type VI secretion system tip protein VgrG [Mesorhizobium sp. WSM3876]RWE27301.1 MAG: type VI secretion system tip protein VgrG [Mesorhizobium sp.]RWF19959.1 MAG: type VI secretion system tip protein VgrG [
MPNERATVVQTPVGADLLTFTHLVGRDEISRCFSYTVGFVSKSHDVDPLKMLGGPVSVEGESDPKRWFSGLVSDFRLTRIEDRLAFYEAVVRPWLWFLGNTTDCRIFQNMTVVEIVEKIFSKYGIAKFEKRLQGSYPSREYCVQYDESDLDFVQRLLEHEGIFYFFEHDEGKHTLILCDAMSKLKQAPGYDKVLYNFEGQASRRDVEYITEWIPGSSVRPGAYAHTDYDFEKPGADLMAKSAQPFSHKEASGENYRQPGAHLDVGRGDTIAGVRREELQAVHQRSTAVGTVRGLHSGCKFKLESFPRDDQNQDYLVVSAEYRLFDPGYRTQNEAHTENFRIVLGVAPTKLPYRPPRITPRPIMRGPQTATVVGPSGEEIFTDKYARVKVQFHWDRLGKKDQNSSCFVRVSQTWAGSGWGFIQIPRIGQEVIVDFIEGDPDLPIITGRVYNASQMPPYGLPGNATQSGWKSNSSKGGGGYNELMFEDKAGSELVNFQAQKDHHLLIKNDRNKLVQHDQSDRIDHDAKHSVGHNLDEDVGNNKTVKIGVDQTTNIGNNDTETVGANRSLTVMANETIHVVANSTENIDANHSQTVGIVQTITVGAARVDTVGAAETRSVGAVQTNTIGASRSMTVGAGQSHDIGASDNWNIAADQGVQIGGGQTFKIAKDQGSDIGAGRSAKIAKDDSTEIGGAHSVKVAKSSLLEIGEDGAIKVGKDLIIDAGASIIIKTGSAAIAMKKDGTITIEGKNITIKGSGKINVKASSDITMKGSKINEN